MKTRDPHVAAVPRLQHPEIGRLVAVGEDGVPWVDYPSAPGAPRPAILAAAPSEPLAASVGRHVVLLFEGGEPERPIVVGWVVEPATERAPAPRTVSIDGERIVIEGTRQVELRCGEASVTLTADGKLVLAAVQVVSDARRVNRIRGAAVRIN